MNVFLLSITQMLNYLDDGREIEIILQNNQEFRRSEFFFKLLGNTLILSRLIAIIPQPIRWAPAIFTVTVIQAAFIIVQFALTWETPATTIAGTVTIRSTNISIVQRSTAEYSVAVSFSAVIVYQAIRSVTTPSAGKHVVA